MSARRRGACALAAALCFGARVDAQDDGAWRGLVADAEAARARGDHARAVTSAREAVALREVPALLLLLAQESRAVGDHVAAWEAADRCARTALSGPASPDPRTVLAVCTLLRDELGASVGLLQVRDGASPEGVSLALGDRSLPRARWAHPVAVARGPLRVALARGGARYVRAVDVGAGLQVLELPAWTAARRGGPRWLLPAGFVALGLGVVAGALWAWTRLDDVACLCPPSEARCAEAYCNRPSPPSLDAVEARLQASAAATLTLGVASAVMLGAALLWPRAPSRPAAEAWTLGLAPIPGAAGLAAARRF